MKKSIAGVLKEMSIGDIEYYERQRCVSVRSTVQRIKAQTEKNFSVIIEKDNVKVTRIK